MTLSELNSLMEDSFGILPEHVFRLDEITAVYRRPDGGKWFAIYMVIPSAKLGILPERPLEIVNVKCDPAMLGSMLRKPGICPAWHMNKSHWISIVLDLQQDPQEVRFLIEQSYLLTAPKIKKNRS